MPPTLLPQRVEETRWFRVCNFLACSGLPKGKSGAFQYWEVFDEWSHGLYHGTKGKTEIAQKGVYSQEKCFKKWMECVNVRRMKGTVYGLGYLKEEVQTEDKPQFSAIMRRLNTSQLADPYEEGSQRATRSAQWSSHPVLCCCL